jgi:hypothetical protein
MRRRAIACKQPKVTVEGHPSGVAGACQAACAVPGCDWTFNSVKTACEEAAVRHRREHREAVPRTWIERDPEYDVHCAPCGGHRRTFGTRGDAEAWLTYHLRAEHGLVSCS